MAPPQPYLVKELERSPMKAMAAPEAAVVLQPIRSVKMLTMGEQKKIMPMAKEPTHAREREKRGNSQDIKQGPGGEQAGTDSGFEGGLSRGAASKHCYLTVQLINNCCCFHRGHLHGEEPLDLLRALCSPALARKSFIS